MTAPRSPDKDPCSHRPRDSPPVGPDPCPTPRLPCGIRLGLPSGQRSRNDTDSAASDFEAHFLERSSPTVNSGGTQNRANETSQFLSNMVPAYIYWSTRSGSNLGIPLNYPSRLRFIDECTFLDDPGPSRTPHGVPKFARLFHFFFSGSGGVVVYPQGTVRT